MYQPKFEYSMDEWLNHFEYFFQSPRGSQPGEMAKYFCRQYKNRAEGLWKRNRCGTAMAYLMRHLNDFELFVVLHEREGVVSAPIVIALGRYYARIPDEYLNIEPAPGRILELAKESAVELAAVLQG